MGGDPIFSDNLFRFGNRDGEGNALLQHPLAVCSLGGGAVLVADSYNHQLKVDMTLLTGYFSRVGNAEELELANRSRTLYHCTLPFDLHS